MRLANLHGRATLVLDEGIIDVAEASKGQFSSSTDVIVGQLTDLDRWLRSEKPEIGDFTTPVHVALDPGLGPVVSRPSQVFAIGLNYRTHAKEMGFTLPSKPMVFTKFTSSLAGANASFEVASERTDYEAELVVVIGKQGRRISTDDALSHVAGYCVGQDLSDRELQLAGSPAQFSLGKSYEHYSPLGPWLTSADEVTNPNRLKISCSLNEVVMQDASTSDMVFSIAQLVSYLSSVVEVYPGDIIFTGSPDGVGQGRTPPVFLKSGDVLETTIEGLGTIRNSAT
jgi:2-keto-4-pentenoate hydratase/2-oxohepta-3-ene-1,7-dioic acid hydratase in catechol pathway